MHSTIVAAMMAMGILTVPFQGDTEAERLRNSALALKEIFGMPDSIPEDLLHKAECVIVIPGVKKVAVGIGGSYGRGAIVCLRQETDGQGDRAGRRRGADRRGAAAGGHPQHSIAEEPLSGEIGPYACNAVGVHTRTFSVPNRLV